MLNVFRSLRFRLALTFILVVGVVLALFAAGASIVWERQIRAVYDGRLIDKADRIASMIGRDARNGLSSDVVDAAIDEQAHGLYFDDFYVQVTEADGVVSLRSSNLQNQPLPPPMVAEAPTPLGAWTLQTISAEGMRRRDKPDAGDLRVATRSFPDAFGRPVVLQVASTTELLAESLGYMRMMFTVVIPMGLLAAGIAAWVVTDRAVGRLAAMAQSARNVTANNLDQRIESAGTDDEIDQVVVQINRMLGRLQNSFDAHESFVANASHELRTPVAVLLTEAQVLARAEAKTEDYRAFARSVEQEMRRLDKMINSLLLLIRMSSGKEVFKREPVSINDVVTEAMAHVNSYSDPRDIAMSVRLAEEDCSGDEDDEPMVAGDEGLLQVLIENLLRNAVQFSTAGQRIEVDVRHVENHVRVTVRDHGPGIPENRIALVFEGPEGGESDDSNGSAADWPNIGLGLSLCRSIVKVHGGRIEAANVADGGSLFTAHLPCA